ncbi:MAG: hypothetical protein Q3966_02590 [Neisseria sp.]|nr:hypothetical protein [Neisseria sp.]
MNRAVFLHVFALQLKQRGISFEDQDGQIQIWRADNRHRAKFSAGPDGSFESSITDSATGSFPFRQEGQWRDTEHLNQLFQTFLERLLD